MLPVRALVFLFEASSYLLVAGAVIGCFPNLYAALAGNMPYLVITLEHTKKDRAVFIQPGQSRYCQKICVT